MIAHGYGMLTTYFSKHFEQLPAKHELIIPEGLHRFYLQGASGRVGASWMTKECREQDILDYNNYLNDLYANLQKDVPLIAFGFSQGVATICRWALQLATPPKHLILWAGVIPPDMNNAAWEKLKTNTKITVFQGDKDPFHKIEYENWTAEIAPNAEKIIYPGGHEIHHDVLLSWVEKNLG
ncbi:MAG: alpha/beta hydrolase [Flavobacteriales bacterium]|nr:MAG: alpha/beta hydrolase [Flavobacteriales bacterium]